MKRRFGQRGLSRSFGQVSPRERREADLFYADLMGLPQPHRLRESESNVLEHDGPGEASFGEADPEPVPRGVAPHILDFRATTAIASDPLAFRTSLREKAVEILEKMDDLGIRDDPRGRCDAYVDAIAWNESDLMRRGLRTCPTSSDGSCLLSSCGLVVRSLWRLLGVRDVFPEKLLDPPYVSGSVMKNLRRFAHLCGALVPVSRRADVDLANPQIGDAIFINKGNSQHVFTVTRRDGNVIESVDGGQGGTGDGGCCSIKRRRRTLDANAAKFVEDSRPITGIIKLDKLRFTAPVIELVRGAPAASP